MRKVRNRAVIKSLSKQYRKNVDSSGFYELLLDELTRNKGKLKYKVIKL